MRRIFCCFLLFVSVIPGLSQGQELGDIRLRPSYQRTLGACRADKKKFKLEIYENAFVSGLNDFLQLTTLSPQGVSAAIANKGVATFVYDFMTVDTTWPALVECMPTKREQKWFLNNMQLSDGMGKAAGLLISVASFKMITGLTQGVYNSLAAISPILAKRAIIATTLAGSAYSFYLIQKRIKEQRQAEANRKDTDIQTDFNKNLRKTAEENMAKLEKLLAQPSLTEEQRKNTEKEIANWKVVLQNF